MHKNVPPPKRLVFCLSDGHHPKCVRDIAR